MDRSGLLHDLIPTAERLMERHLSTTKEWFPHELVPWSRGRDFEPGETVDESASPLPAPVRSALFVNLLTEDNLPHYFRTIYGLFGRNSVWGEWARRWTAEEGRHSIVIRDYLTVTRAIDPINLERARMHQVSTGQVPEPDDPIDGFAYVALQELATRIAHRNTGKLLNDDVGYQVMGRVAVDENFHFLFYRDLVKACIERDPSASVISIERQVRDFEMPGTGIVDFTTHAQAIAKAGIYDLQIHHDQILAPVVLREWGVAGLKELTPEAEAARESLMKRIALTERAGRRLADRREEPALL